MSRNNIDLQRRGYWLIADQGSWQIRSVEGPLESEPIPGRQVFRVQTASEDILLVSRSADERGMRELRLEAIQGSEIRSA